MARASTLSTPTLRCSGRFRTTAPRLSTASRRHAFHGPTPHAARGQTHELDHRADRPQHPRCLSVSRTPSTFQVSALQWSQHDKELVSAHGYSHNHLILWKYPSMARVAQLPGHTSRILHMSQSPDGQTVVTASADETLRFWKILQGGDASKRERAAVADSIFRSATIR